MSKSKGNFLTVRQLHEEHGADATRIAAASAGDGADDANFDLSFLAASKRKMGELLDILKTWKGKGVDEKRTIDAWFASMVNECIERTTVALENVQNKAAVQAAFLDLPNAFKWYLTRTQNKPQKKMVETYVEVQTLLLTPFIPHVAEEMWSLLGKKGFVSQATWPKAGKQDEQAVEAEALVKTVLEDMKEVRKITGITPKKVCVITAPSWKYDLFTLVKKQEGKDQKEIIGAVMKDATLKKQGKEIMKFLPKMIQTKQLPLLIKNEQAVLEEAIPFFADQMGAEIDVLSADTSEESKAKQAMPGKPALLLT